MPEQVCLAFSAIVTVAEEIGFTFDEPGDHLNDDGVWEYHLDTHDGWGWIVVGPEDEPVETSYPGWGDIEIKPFTAALFKDGAMAGLLTPKGGTLGGLFQADVDHIDELEDHIIGLVADEIEHLGGDPSEFREAIDA